MATIKFANSGDEENLPDGERIQEVCEAQGVPFACTEGVCGTCIVEVEEGMENLSSYTEEEEDFLGEMENERMACQCRLLKGNVTLRY